MSRFTLRQLEYLVACIDQCSIAAAAEVLHVSQPTISVAITKLETQLGIQLLLRHHSQGVSATASAENILPAARALLAYASELQRQAMLNSTSIAGELRLGSFTTLAPVVLPDLMRELAQEYPAIRLQIREGSQETIIKDLLDGKLDVALLYALDLPESLQCIPIAETSPYVALPYAHPLAKKTQLSLAELADQPLILLDVSPSREYFLSLFRRAELKPHIAHSSPSIELVRGLVGQGLGYSILVTRPQGDLTYDGQPLAIRPLADTVASSTIVLATLADLKRTRLLSAFEALVSRVFPKTFASPPPNPTP